MCGRFTQHYTWAEVHAFLSVLGPPRNLQPHYNIAPTRTIDVIRLNQDGKRALVPMRWGGLSQSFSGQCASCMRGQHGPTSGYGMGFQTAEFLSIVGPKKARQSAACLQIARGK